MNDITKRILLGISTVIGLAVAGTIYKTVTKNVEDQMLLGDGEVIYEEENRD